jgi:hypothetical protein
MMTIILTRHRAVDSLITRHRADDSLITRHRADDSLITRHRADDICLTRHRADDLQHRCNHQVVGYQKIHRAKGMQTNIKRNFCHIKIAFL